MEMPQTVHFVLAWLAIDKNMDSEAEMQQCQGKHLKSALLISRHTQC